MKNYDRKKGWLYIFLLTQAILYCSFIVLDIKNVNIQGSNNMKFTIIILCFCYALFIARSAFQKHLLLLRVALFFTVIADIFLLLMDYHVMGVISFVIVQQVYGIRMDFIENRTVSSALIGIRIKDYILRMGGQFLITFSMLYITRILGIPLDLLLLATVFYFVTISWNVIRAVKITIADLQNRGNLLFAAGMILFWLCDVNVGIFNAAGYIDLNNNIYYTIYSLSAVLMWAFYAPSQVLITLSSK